MDGQWFPRQRFQFGAGDLPANVGVAYYAHAVDFDSSTYLTRGAALTGSATSKLLTWSAWINFNLDNVVNTIWCFSDGSSRTRLVKQASGGGNDIAFLGINSAGTQILNYQSSATFSSSSGWTHLVTSVDLSDTGKRHFYVNGSSDGGSWGVYTDDSLDFTVSEFLVGARHDTAARVVANIADFFLWPGQYIDLSDSDNLAMFISGGKPVNPAAAITALGAPLVRLSGPTATWHENKGSGGGLTENGALTEASTSPSD